MLCIAQTWQKATYLQLQSQMILKKSTIQEIVNTEDVTTCYINYLTPIFAKSMFHNLLRDFK